MEDLIDLGDQTTMPIALAPNFRDAGHASSISNPITSAEVDLMSDSVADYIALQSLGSAFGMDGVGRSVSATLHTTERPCTNAIVRERRPITLPMETLMVHGAADRLPQADEKARRDTKVNFIISHDPDLVKDVIEAIHKEMSGKRDDVLVEVRGSPPAQYLRIIAPSKHIAVQCIHTAQTLTDEMIADKTVPVSAIFLEPPGNMSKDSVRIVLDNEAAGARPRLLPPVTQTTPDSTELETYMDHFCRQLCVALKKVGRLNSDYNLKVRFGHFVLKSYRPRSSEVELYNFDQFSALIHKPRAGGHSQIASQIGNLKEAMRVLQAIKRENSPFCSPNFTIPEASSVKPEFVFDVYSTHYRFAAHLVPTNKLGDKKHTATMFTIPRIQAFKAFAQDRGSGEIDMITLSVDKEFDWKIETVNELPETERPFEMVDAYLTSAATEMPDAATEENPDEAYPHVRLGKHKFAEQVDKVVVRSIFQFRYEHTPYILQFTIHRQWESIRDMSQKLAEPSVTYSVTVHRDHWSDGLRASDIGNYGSGWGDELQLLFRDDGLALPNGLARVHAFMSMIQAIRSALETE